MEFRELRHEIRPLNPEYRYDKIFWSIFYVKNLEI